MLDTPDREKTKASRAEYFRAWRAKEKVKKENVATEPVAASVAPDETSVAPEPEIVAQHAETPVRLPEPPVQRPEPEQPQSAVDISRPRSGTTLQAALKDYARLEDLCRQDPLAGIDAMAEGLNWNPQAVAYAYGVRHGVVEPPAPAPEVAPEPGATAVANATIASFRQDPRNEFMPLVEAAMRELLLGGQAQTLFEAYDLACMTSPLVQEIKMNRNRPQQPVNPYQRNAATQQARSQAKHIGGAPSTDVRPKTGGESQGSQFDDVAAAVRRQKGL